MEATEVTGRVEVSVVTVVETLWPLLMPVVCADRIRLMEEQTDGGD